MTGTPAEQALTLHGVGALPAAPEPSDLAVAVRVAQYILARYGAVGHADVFALNQAYGAVTESLRILLRAVENAEPIDEQEAARRSVDRAFPVVAAFLADERAEAGEGQ
ncbi:hypothetical protein ACFPH6_19470 [Streptomyces xiangluensis]|uniref:Uncharacterized protein n=1 Tax=Streptomyces xiangluensis TaxID=2665720 RepID=A0ABV8YQF3_9ACTN